MKRYVREPGSVRVRRLMAASSPATSRLSEVEIASALARRWREGSLPAPTRDRLLGALALDLEALHLIELTRESSALARSLLLRHPLRAADAVQLASCLVLQQGLGRPVPLVAFDRRLREAAAREGLAVAP